MLQQGKSNQTGQARPAERGQVLLIVILVIIVSLTIGLSLASRGITNLRTSTEEADSQKSLAAAEAGIEKALQNTVPNSGNFNLSTTYETTVVPQGGDTFLVNGGSLVTQNEGADIWLAEHNPDGSINYATVLSPIFFHLYWGAPSEVACDSTDSSKWPAAIEAIVVSGTSSTNITTTRYAYDYCSRGNNFFLPNLGTSANPILANFRIRTPESGGVDQIKITNGIFVRVNPIYKSTVIGVSACSYAGGSCTILPSQGFQITSTGTTGTVNRKLNVFKGYQQIFLPYMSYGLFVPTR